MKRSTLLIITIFIVSLISVSFAKAQNLIPNADFENWSNGIPDQWDTSNGNILGTEFICVTRETVNPQNGSSAAKVQTVSHNIIFVGEVIMPGILTLGDVVIDILNQTGTVIGGVPVSGYPKFLKGYFRYQPAAGDSCLVGIGLTKWNGTSRDTIAYAYSKFGGLVASWQEFTVPIHYLNFVEPDSMNIMLISSNIETGEALAGSTLWVDNLWLEYSGVAVNNVGFDKAIYVYPSTDSKSLVVKTGNVKASHIDIYSINGNLIDSNSVLNKGQSLISIADLTSGIYIVRVTFGDGTARAVKFAVL